MYDLERKYYTYALLDPRKPGSFYFGSQSFEHEPFYIGKGTGYRLKAHFTEARRLMGELDARKASISSPLVPPSSVPLKPKEEQKLIKIIEIMRETGKEPIAVKIDKNLNEFESYEHEAELIRNIGRKAKGMGPLTNETDGEQFSGARPIRLKNFIGMNNIRKEGEPNIFTSNGLRVCSPRIVLNADVTGGGRILKRAGQKLLTSLPGAHSLWADDDIMLAASYNRLFRILNGEPIELCSVDGPSDAELYYAKADGYIYISNKHWKGVLDPLTNTLTHWELDIPDAPMVVPETGGQLDQGKYNICFTKVTGNSYGIPGPTSELVLSTGENAFSIINRNSDEIVWLTDPNSDKFYYLGSVDSFAGPFISADILSTCGYSTAPCLDFLTHAYSRMWGAIENILFYSDPFRYDLFSPYSYIQYNSPIQMIAPVFSGGEAGTTRASIGGLYLGFNDKTIFLTGPNPLEMAERHVGAGSVRGTLAYCNNVPKLGNNVPIWVSHDGIVAGTGGGTLVNLTNDKIRFAPGVNGSSVGKTRNGEFQFLTNFRRRSDASGVGFGDSTTAEVIRKGKVINETE